MRQFDKMDNMARWLWLFCIQSSMTSDCLMKHFMNCLMMSYDMGVGGVRSIDGRCGRDTSK